MTSSLLSSTICFSTVICEWDTGYDLSVCAMALSINANSRDNNLIQMLGNTEVQIHDYKLAFTIIKLPVDFILCFILIHVRMDLGAYVRTYGRTDVKYCIYNSYGGHLLDYFLCILLMDFKLVSKVTAEAGD